MAIELGAEIRKELEGSLRHYFLAERGEEIGDLAASMILDFILEEIGPSIYNQAIKDAQSFVQRTVGEMDLTLYVEEFGYSGTRSR